MSETATEPPVSQRTRRLLQAAVESVGGTERPGQVAMADAVTDALATGRHLLVQAGTGTGKSLGYLVPSLLHRDRVVVATATLGLQHQLVERDLPAVHDAAEAVTGSEPSYAVVKGRSNYACLHRVREGVPDEDQGSLVDLPEDSLGQEVVELRSWVEEQATAGGVGDKESAPSHTDRAWRQVSVTHRECLGASRCPYGLECFAEQARERAQSADVVVTNHALLAIDAIEGVPMLPEYDAVVVDEAHELTARVTQAATAELDAELVERAARRARPHVQSGEPQDLTDGADALSEALAALPEGRLDALDPHLATALALVRDAARSVLSGFPRETSDADADAARQQARAAVEEVRLTAERMAGLRETEVLWRAEARGGPVLRIAPIDVSASLRDKVFAEKTVVLTSATLALGGTFAPVAASVGLDPRDAQKTWRGLDVGSPFDYARQGICYVAAHLPAPSRDGITDAQLDEIAALVEAAGGRTLGLFSSRRAAETAAEGVRSRLGDHSILCQGDAQLSELTRRFAAEEATSLFGTLSLWQGIDVPGSSCSLVIIDKIPFPRPDDPLMSARQRLVEKRGGNGFMAVAATHAALLLAQGAGRLVRSTDDRGVVAVLDPRLVTARYGSFLAASLPPMWRTTDRDAVLGALERLNGES